MIASRNGCEVHPDCFLCRQPAEMVELCRVSFGAIARCAGCGLVRIWPPRSAEVVAQLHNTPEYFQHPYFAARRDVSSDALLEKHRALLRRVNAGRAAQGLRMLDIGCDTGELLKVARDDFQMDVLGVDVSLESARAAYERNGIEVRVGQITTLNLPHKSFDLVTLIDIIEHVTDPVAVLQSVRDLLAPAGRVYVTTTDHDALIFALGRIMYRALGKVSRPIVEKLYIPFHEFYFNRATLARLVTQCDLEVVSHGQLEFPLAEFGHGIVLKMGLVPIFGVQRLIGRQTLQELVAVSREPFQGRT